jgi:hypothetical protein
LLERGETEAALAEARAGTELARAVQDPQVLNSVLAIEARIRLAAGDRPGADALADELAASWRSTGIRRAHECSEAPWVFTELKRGDELRAVLEAARLRTAWHEAAERILDEDFVRAAEVFGEIGSVPDEAHARLRAAEEAVRAARRAEADSQLRLTLPVFAQLGARAWQAEAEALLAASA